jgi:LysM repeat protein
VSQTVITGLLFVALILPFVGALLLRMFNRFLPSSITVIVAAIFALLIVSSVLSLAAMKTGSLRIGNITLLLPVAAVNRPVDVSNDILEMDEEVAGTPTPYPEVTITPIPTPSPTATVEPTLTPLVEPTSELSEGEIISDTEVITDGTTTDSGSTDGSTTDSGSTDGSTTDSGSTSGSTTDSGSTSGSTTDSGSSTGTQPTLILVPTPAANLTVYYVKAGESLGQIAEKFGVTIEQIEDANPMLQNPNNLVVGQELYIP